MEEECVEIKSRDGRDEYFVGFENSEGLESFGNKVGQYSKLAASKKSLDDFAIPGYMY